MLGSLALGGDLSVWMAFGWFALALLIHAVAVASRRR